MKTQLHLQHRAFYVEFYTVLSREFSPFAPKGHLREGKCHLSLGNAMAASRCFQKVLELEPSNREALQEVGIT